MHGADIREWRKRATEAEKKLDKTEAIIALSKMSLRCAIEKAEEAIAERNAALADLVALRALVQGATVWAVLFRDENPSEVVDIYWNQEDAEKAAESYHRRRVIPWEVKGVPLVLLLPVPPTDPAPSEGEVLDG